MEIKRENILSLQIDNESDVGVCRRKAVSLASQMGFDEVKTGEVAIMVTELVTNVINHGGGKGKVVICQFRDAQNHKAIEIWCCDSGNGISDFQKSIKDGVSRKDSLGIGMGTIRRFSDEMEINPVYDSEFRDTFFSGEPRYKHCIRTLKYVPNKHRITTNNKLEIGAVSICKPGETFNGDSYVVSHINSNVSVASVIDGLGHGREANLASQLAREQIILKSELPLDALMQHVHNSLRGSRGSTIGLIRLDTETRKIAFTGIGNIESFLISEEGKQNLLSFGGIMGHNMRTPRVFEYDFNPGDSICMYSDGITTRWKFEDIDWTEHPQKIAETIINKYSRLNDDATVLIIRYTA
ncbi:MAG: SpoIIE family protein phosphatase [Bacteroidales bacterium]|nr:SpoIIE family protein phosphatase [Bacteroidales bacterium]MCF8457929.1 SpoIIE family protein phosphatase [Bacteroidales bacterium]